MLQEREREGLTIQACVSASAEIARRKAAGIPRVFATRYADEFDHLWEDKSPDAASLVGSVSELEEGEIRETASEKAASLMRERNASSPLSNQTGTGLHQTNTPFHRGADPHPLHQRPPAPKGPGSILKNAPSTQHRSLLSPSAYAHGKLTSKQAWEIMPTSPLNHKSTEHKPYFTPGTALPSVHLISPNEPSQLHTKAHDCSSNGGPRQQHDASPQWKRWVRQCSEHWDVQDTVPVRPYLTNNGGGIDGSGVVGLQVRDTTTTTTSTLAVSSRTEKGADDFLEELGQELLGRGKLPGRLLNG
ncbi:uncharacterized protein K452DRAFT_148450 [Aplosporella prunicola CBS 121167]|uniref:Uncharacterized protein n=1 Tax=Aplosporella prunicola CBS 121167 TaxID=1176127 RepID=A0A6A6AYR0_9PEZI|nr:uncharacterized protein K452DRAFT_148450 [Aplosporella prunicola CBS 121167]KAF2136105.1 hypothetical protein K452DRAFT_148450 [Aplosporella prunicola CBS 121167]